MREDKETATIIAMERAALDRWGKGDPSGFLEICSPDVVYFDNTLERRLDGLEALTCFYEKIRGKIHMDRYDLLNPKVQLCGDAAVLTYNFVGYAEGKAIDGIARRCIGGLRMAGASSRPTGRTRSHSRNEQLSALCGADLCRGGITRQQAVIMSAACLRSGHWTGGRTNCGMLSRWICALGVALCGLCTVGVVRGFAALTLRLSFCRVPIPHSLRPQVFCPLSMSPILARSNSLSAPSR